MTDHDLKQALHLAATNARPTPDPADDLARARAASSARSRRRVRAGLSGLAAVAVLGIGTTAVVAGADPSDGPSAGATATAPDAPAGVQLVAATFDATPYTFDLTPKGWSVQGQNPYAVTIVPDDGSTSDNPDDFVGKLVIMFDANEPDGREVDVDGRQFWVSDGDSGYTTIATRTRGDEPGGVVRIQYPDDAGWDRDSMLAFLASVHVGDAARQGQG